MPNLSLAVCLLYWCCWVRWLQWQYQLRLDSLSRWGWPKIQQLSVYVHPNKKNKQHTAHLLTLRSHRLSHTYTLIALCHCTGTSWVSAIWSKTLSLYSASSNENTVYVWDIVSRKCKNTNMSTTFSVLK